MDLSLLQRRIFKDKAARWVMLVLTVLSLLLLIAIGIGLFFKSRLILSEHSLWELLSGSAWKPLSGEFGFLPFIVGTLFVTALSIAIALPISLLSAIFLTEYASSWVKRIVFPIFDILAGIPSVVYGVWGTLIIVPWIADKLGPRFVDYTSGYTVLASGIVLGIMILPILVSLLIEIFTIVPQDYREASASLGATKWQTCSKVILRKAMPGIVAAVVLSISKAFGETIAVLMEITPPYHGRFSTPVTRFPHLSPTITVKCCRCLFTSRLSCSPPLYCSLLFWCSISYPAGYYEISSGAIRCNRRES